MKVCNTNQMVTVCGSPLFYHCLCMIAAAHTAFSDDGHFCEMDSHADTSIVGNGFAHYTEPMKYIDVYPYSDEYNPI